MPTSSIWLLDSLAAPTVPSSDQEVEEEWKKNRKRNKKKNE
jgi:hypothetical protein